MKNTGRKVSVSSDDSGENPYPQLAAGEPHGRTKTESDSSHHLQHRSRERRPSRSPRQSCHFRQDSPHYWNWPPRFANFSSNPRKSSPSPKQKQQQSDSLPCNVNKEGNSQHRYKPKSGYQSPAKSAYHSSGRSGYHSPGGTGYHSPARTGYHSSGGTGYSSPGRSGYHSPRETGCKPTGNQVSQSECRKTCKSSDTAKESSCDVENPSKDTVNNEYVEHSPSVYRIDNPRPIMQIPVPISTHGPYGPGSPLIYACPDPTMLPCSVWAPLHQAPMFYGCPQQQPTSIEPSVQYAVSGDISSQLLSVLQPNIVTVQTSSVSQPLPSTDADSKALLALLRKQTQQPNANGSPAHATGSSQVKTVTLDSQWMAATQCLPSCDDRKTPPTKEQCETAALQVTCHKSDCSSTCTGSSESLPAIGVFWDIENCPVSANKSALTVVQRVREKFFSGHREAEFMCVCDVNKESKTVVQELNDAQVTVAHINATAKNAADDKLRQSLRRFADTHNSPATVVLISGDVNFANDLSDLRHRHNLKIILVHRPEVADALLACAHETLCYTDLLSDVPFRAPVKVTSSHTELLVDNIPTGVDTNHIRNRLLRLSNNCGGRVISVKANTAVLKFSTPEHTARAKKRLQGEDVFGNKISVSFANGKSRSHNGKNGNGSQNKKEKDNSSTENDSETDETGKFNRGALMIQQQLYQEKQEHQNGFDPSQVCYQFSNGENAPLQQAIENEVTKVEEDPDNKENQIDATPEYPKRIAPVEHAVFKRPRSLQSPVTVQPVYGPIPTYRISPIPSCMLSTAPTIPQYPSGIEILVSNLDENLPKRELRRILLSVFREHCKVLHVALSSGPLQAVVRVPRMADAHIAIAHINRHKIGSKRVNVTLAPNPNSGLDYLRNQVVSILSDIHGGSLPLFKFSEIYDNRFKRPLHVSDLYQIPDTVIIQDTPTGRMVSLTYYVCKADKLPQLPTGSRNSPIIISPIPSREPTPEPCEEYCSVHDECTEGDYTSRGENPCIVEPLKTFSAQVHTLLQIHDGRMPLISFAICYATEFRLLKMDDNNGVPLEHLLTCIQGVRVAISRQGFKTVCWTQNNCRPPTPAPGGVLRSPSPILTPQLFQFSKEVVELLKNSSHCRMSFSKFIPAYHHHFGRQCRVAEYGFTKLIELFDAIPHIIQVMGVYCAKTLTLTHRSQVKRFTQDLLKVLKSQASKLVCMAEFPVAYQRCFARDWHVTDYGVCELQDLLNELAENTVMISGYGDEMVISIPRRDQTPEEIIKTKKFAKDVIDMLRHQPRFRMAFSRFIPAYHHHFGRQCRVADYGFNKLIELFEALNDTVKVFEHGDEKIVCLTYVEQLSVVAKQFIYLLRRNRAQSLLLDESLLIYAKQYGHPLCLDDFNVTSVTQLMNKFPCIVQVIGHGSNATICLIDRTCLQEFAHQTLVLLMEQDNGRLSVDEFAHAYFLMWSHRITPIEYGFSKITDLLKAVSHICKVRNEWTEDSYVELIPLHQFARKARLLLRKHHGAIAFMKFAEAYLQMFGNMLQPSQYGCGNLSALLALVPQVLSITGRGPGKTVTLNSDLKGRSFKRTKSYVEGGKDGGDVIIEDEVPDEVNCRENKKNARVFKEPVVPVKVKSVKEGSPEKGQNISASNNTELLDMKSPEDLLCHGFAPSGLPSPALIPEYIHKDLISFESPPPLPSNIDYMMGSTKDRPSSLDQHWLDANDGKIYGLHHRDNTPVQPSDEDDRSSLYSNATNISRPRSRKGYPKCKIAANFSVPIQK
uniref:Meiosis regulator and mRNA stability factor 1 n=1 Tax=Saccoglossus kowalevskii TaxID=10224 RepID=A0ABM0MF92_SACKO|nr:PREDICTED: meiosis arrest female protein 1-like [Saccoglossus kowalevskii]